MSLFGESPQLPSEDTPANFITARRKRELYSLVVNHSAQLRVEELTEAEQNLVDSIQRETAEGLRFLKKYSHAVTFLGGSGINQDSSHYKDAQELAKRLVKKNGVSIITGGGPGAMEAANKGAQEAGGDSVGLKIKLPDEKPNGYMTDSMEFENLPVRRDMLLRSGKALVFFPGGFGTFDELFEVLTLMKIGRMPRVPVVLVGKHYWDGLDKWIKKQMQQNHQTIAEADLSIYTIVDSVNEAHKAISARLG